MYLYFLDGEEVILNFHHKDVKPSNITIDDIEISDKSLVLHKKAMVYLGYDFGVDLNSFLHYFVGDTIKNETFYPKVMEQMTSQLRKDYGLNKVVPFTKLIEFAKNIVMYVLPYYKSDSYVTDLCKAYCDDYTNVFQAIESNPVIVDGVMKKQNYMWYTTTSRPSNAFDGYNFSALNKKDGTRNSIKSRFEDGTILQFDFDAFHIKLLAKILGYKFTEHPYVQLEKEIGMDIDYDAFKSLVFQNIYGGIRNEFLQHPFFMQVQAVIETLFDDYNEHGFVKSWFYEKRFREIDDANSNKVFNYFLQSLETEYNVRKIKDILPLLENKKSVLMMYMYDAFIFDIHPDEKYLIDKLKQAFETDNMTVKISAGQTFGELSAV